MEHKKQKEEAGAEVIKKDSKRAVFELTVKGVIVKDGKVLAIRRSKTDWRFPGHYDLPGGTIEKAEAVQEALKREISEEVGLEVEIGPVLEIFDITREYFLDESRKNKVQVDGKGIRFLAFYKSGEVELSFEHDKFEWLSFDEALKKFSQDGFEADKYRAILKAKEYLSLKDGLLGWQRCRADFENYKKRQEESRKDLIAYANENLILDILPVIDNFHASTEHIPEDQKDNPWVTGIMYIQKQMEKVLEDNGVKEIEVKIGDEFDPTLMEALKQETENNEVGKGKVKKIVQKGYRIDSRVVRAARVVVE